jgi:hypothetical protein
VKAFQISSEEEVIDKKEGENRESGNIRFGERNKLSNLSKIQKTSTANETI